MTLKELNEGGNLKLKFCFLSELCFEALAKQKVVNTEYLNDIDL